MATQNSASKNSALSLLASIGVGRSVRKDDALLHLDVPTAFFLHDFLSDVYCCLSCHPESETAKFFTSYDSGFTPANFEDQVMPMMAQISHALLDGAMAFTIPTNLANRRWLDCVRRFQLEIFTMGSLDREKHPHVAVAYTVSRELVEEIADVVDASA